MSLHCPATLVVARHGEATYGPAPGMSDHGGALTAAGRRQARALGERLSGDGLAGVYTSTMGRAAETGEIAAEVLGLPVGPVEGLHEVRVGDCAGLPFGDPCFHGVFDAWLAGDLGRRVPGGEDGHEVRERVREALQSLADLHRGEQVLVVAHGAVISFVVPSLCDNLRDDHVVGRPGLPTTGAVRVEVGDDGWRAGPWPV